MQGGGKGALGGEDPVRAVDDRHHLACRLSLTDDHAFEPSSFGVGVIRHDLEAVKELSERRGDRVRRIRADGALIRRHHTVRGRFVQTADDSLALALVDELRLVAVARDLG